MNSDLHRKIQAAAAEWRSRNAHTVLRPRKLFLGHEEYKAAAEEAMENMELILNPHAIGDRRPEWYGMKIYRVDDARYVGVAE